MGRDGAREGGLGREEEIERGRITHLFEAPVHDAQFVARELCRAAQLVEAGGLVPHRLHVNVIEIMV